jgi:hypothetical protein
LDSSGRPSSDRDPSHFALKVSGTVGKSNDYRRVRAITPVVVGPGPCLPRKPDTQIEAQPACIRSRWSAEQTFYPDAPSK